MDSMSTPQCIVLGKSFQVIFQNIQMMDPNKAHLISRLSF